MPVNINKFYSACNPSITLNYADSEHRKYYIDFTEVRSANLIKELKRTILLSDLSDLSGRAETNPTCQLFSGHIGCGKSTELLRLKTELESEGYHTVYFESSEDLDMGDIDVTDILLLIARKISESLEKIQIRLAPNYFSKLFGEIKDFLAAEIDLSAQAGFSIGLAKISAKTKKSPKVRARLREYLESRTDSIISSINNEVLAPAVKQLKEKGYQGLVVIVDNLDRIHQTMKTSERTQAEYIFFDRGEELRRLGCHLVYTIPLILTFSNDATAMFNSRFGVRPKVLSMVPVRLRDGQVYEKGIEFLKKMVLARAFPETEPEQREERVEELFEKPETLEQVCKISGGHIRNLLGYLYSCLQKEDPPFPEDVFEDVIQEFRDDLVKRITSDEWELIRQVVKDQSVAGEENSNKLLKSMFMFEYQLKKHGMWFDVNPLLEEHRELSDIV